MIDINSWLNEFQVALNHTFENRIYFVGLQGSYARNEATENSDIDVVVILDYLTIEDLESYDRMLNTLPCRDLICGFISGKNEIFNWEQSDLFQFYHDTTPIIGSLDDLLKVIDKSAVDRAIKNGLCNIYHGCVHNMLHDKSIDILKGLYKSACFVIQAIYFKENDKYIKLKNELLNLASPEERKILELSIEIKNNKHIDFKKFSENLFNWTKQLINT